MKIYDSELWSKDLKLITDAFPEISEFAGQSIMITGAGGLIGSAITDVLIQYNETHRESITIYAAGRSKEKLAGRFAPYFDRPYFHFLPYDSSKMNNELSFSCDYVIHGAGNASPDLVMKEPVETMLSNFLGLSNLLDYARDYGVKKTLYISSSEIYGRKENNDPFGEKEYGYIDLLNPRNSYSVGKRAAETLCASYATEYGVQSVIVRPGHIYGPTASPVDGRVSSAWPYLAAQGKNIVMKSDGGQIRSYCYCLDCASAVLTILLRGESVRAYNISNPNSIISIREMAEILAKAGHVELIREEASQIEKERFNPMTNSSLDSVSLLSLGWRGLFDAATGFEHTVQIIREN